MKKRNRTGLIPLSPGQIPRPRRIGRIAKETKDRHAEVVAVQNMTEKLLGMDPRTIASYRKTLAALRVAQGQLGEIITFLGEALGESDD